MTDDNPIDWVEHGFQLVNQETGEKVEFTPNKHILHYDFSFSPPVKTSVESNQVPTKITDVEGAETTITYSDLAAGRMDTISNSAGKFIFEYGTYADIGNGATRYGISKITDSAGRQVHYTYSDSPEDEGGLASVQVSGKLPMEYKYIWIDKILERWKFGSGDDEEILDVLQRRYLLTEVSVVSNGLRRVLTKYEYDNYPLTYLHGNLNKKTEYHLDGSSTSTSYNVDFIEGRIIEYEEGAPSNKVTYYDSDFRPVLIRENYGLATMGSLNTLYKYDSHGRIESITDPKENVTAYEYLDLEVEANGNTYTVYTSLPTKVTYPDAQRKSSSTTSTGKAGAAMTGSPTGSTPGRFRA